MPTAMLQDVGGRNANARKRKRHQSDDDDSSIDSRWCWCRFVFVEELMSSGGCSCVGKATCEFCNYNSSSGSRRFLFGEW